MRSHNARLQRLEARAPSRGALLLRVIVAPAQGETIAEKQAEALAAWEREHGGLAPADVDWIVREIVDPA